MTPHNTKIKTLKVLGLLVTLLMVSACADKTPAVMLPEPTMISSPPAGEQALPTRPAPPTASRASSPSATVEETPASIENSVTPAGSVMAELTPSQGEAIVQVEIGEYYVDPHVLTITVGTKVEWIPFGDREHTIISKKDGQPGWPRDGGVGGIGSPSFRSTFKEPGVYPYFCSIHPSVMDGVVVVIENN